MAKKKEKPRMTKQLDKEADNLQTMKRKRMELAGTIVLLILIIAACALGLWKISGADKSPEKKVVFRVGEEAVCLDEVNLCILQNVVDLGIGEAALDTTAEDGSSANDYYKQEILRLIMDYKIEAAIARKQNLALTKSEKESVQQDVTEYLGQIDGRILSELGLKQERVVAIYEERYLAHKLEETVTDEVEVENQRYCTLYMLLFPKVEINENGDYLKEEDGETPVMLSEDEIAKRKKDADEAYERLQDGADITELAKEYGVESVSGEQSNMEDSFPEPFKEYAASLKKGESSPVIDIASCYAIVEMVKEDNEEFSKQVMERYRGDVQKDALKKKRQEWYEEIGVEEADFVGSTWQKLSLYDFAKYVEE